MNGAGVRADRVVVAYGAERALDGVCLDVEPGGSLAVVGPSGCGKTSLLLALAGLRNVDGGSIEIGGTPVSGPRSGTSIVFQDHALFPWKTCRGNVALAPIARGIERADAYAKADAVLAELGLTEHARKFPDRLSGGQRQRAAIARALAASADLILLDEPSSSLDAITKEDFQKLVLAQYKKRGFTLVAVTHDIEEAVFLGRRVSVMSRSRIHASVDNPLFGDEGLRDKAEFYDLCRSLRAILAEAAR